MLIPRYWSCAAGEATAPAGKHIAVSAWGGSRISLADAGARAREVVERMTQRIRSGDGFPERYGYGQRPLREEVLQEYTAGNDELRAAITRNRQGMLILNTAGVVFIDVDLPKFNDGSSLFGRLLDWVLRRPAAEVPDHSAEALQRLRQWIEHHPSWGARAYRTRSGLRYLLTHGTYWPNDSQVEDAMEFLGADPQYRRLCSAQQSFRARLTPKPWRIGIQPPPYRFPWNTPQEEQAMRQWEKRYERTAQNYASCHFIEAIGNQEMAEEVKAFAQLHDEHSRSDSGLPLA